MLEKLPDVVGHVLHEQRAGLDKLAIHKVELREGLGMIQVRSLVFVDHGPLPPLYTADGTGLSPPLRWTGVPPGATSLVLMVEDADSPTPQPLVHAIVVGMPANQDHLPEGAISELQPEEDDQLKVGKHSLLRPGWLPPDPPPGHGIHRYAFQIFALASNPGFSSTPGREEVLEAVRMHGIAAGWTMATYERPDGSDKLTIPDALQPATS